MQVNGGVQTKEDFGALMGLMVIVIGLLVFFALVVYGRSLPHFAGHAGDTMQIRKLVAANDLDSLLQARLLAESGLCMSRSLLAEDEECSEMAQLPFIDLLTVDEYVGINDKIVQALRRSVKQGDIAVIKSIYTKDYFSDHRSELARLIRSETAPVLADLAARPDADPEVLTLAGVNYYIGDYISPNYRMARELLMRADAPGQHLFGLLRRLAMESADYPAAYRWAVMCNADPQCKTVRRTWSRDRIVFVDDSAVGDIGDILKHMSAEQIRLAQDSIYKERVHAVR